MSGGEELQRLSSVPLDSRRRDAAPLLVSEKTLTSVTWSTGFINPVDTFQVFLRYSIAETCSFAAHNHVSVKNETQTSKEQYTSGQIRVNQLSREVTFIYSFSADDLNMNCLDAWMTPPPRTQHSEQSFHRLTHDHPRHILIIIPAEPSWLALNNHGSIIIVKELGHIKLYQPVNLIFRPSHPFADLSLRDHEVTSLRLSIGAGRLPSLKFVDLGSKVDGVTA